MLALYLERRVLLQTVLHAVTEWLQRGIQQAHPLLQALQRVLHQGLLLPAAQPAGSSTQEVPAQVHFFGHGLQLFIEDLERGKEVSVKASTVL